MSLHARMPWCIVLSVILAVAAAGEEKPVRSCESLSTVTLPNTTIESAALQPAANGNPEYCLVTAVVTHPPASDKVTIWMGMPASGWNGRFEGTGGGGFMGGSARGLVGPVHDGYAAGATDTGHAAPDFFPGGPGGPGRPGGPHRGGALLCRPAARQRDSPSR